MITPFLHVLTKLHVQEYATGWYEIAGDCAGHTWTTHCIWQSKQEAELALEEIEKALPANYSRPLID